MTKWPQNRMPDGRNSCYREVARIVPMPSSHSKEIEMTIHLEIVPILSLVAGIAILLVPRLLNYIVAAYLIIAGLAGIFA